MVKRIVENNGSRLSLSDAREANRKRLLREEAENRASSEKKASGTTVRPCLRRGYFPPPVSPPPPVRIALDEQAKVEGKAPAVGASASPSAVPAQGVIARYLEAKRTRGEPPHPREILSTVMSLRDTHTNAQIGRKFGFAGNTAETWSSYAAGLRRIPDNVWEIIDEGSKRKGVPKFDWLTRLSRQHPELQLETARRWADAE